MTGRENVYLNGAILGLHKHEIDAQFDEIVDFAEIGEFIDAPVATYSSGMRVRLGFAVATSVSPSLLLIDEVLAVGDMGFRMKCLNRLASIMDTSAIIFVSHSMPDVMRVCDQIMHLQNGVMRCLSHDCASVVSDYYSVFEGNTGSTFQEGATTVTDVMLNGRCGSEFVEIAGFGPLEIGMCITLGKILKTPMLRIVLWNQAGLPVLEVLDENHGHFSLQKTTDPQYVTVKLARLALNAGRHTVNIAISDGIDGEILYRGENVAAFGVKASLASWAGYFSPAFCDIQTKAKCYGK